MLPAKVYRRYRLRSRSTKILVAQPRTDAVKLRWVWGISMKIFFSTLALLAVCANSANAADCKSIADPQARLACFDRPVAQKPHSVKNVVAAPEFTAAKGVIERKLKDPMSAQWADLFKVKTKEGEFVCGAVNSKNSYGAMSVREVSFLTCDSTRRPSC